MPTGVYPRTEAGKNILKGGKHMSVLKQDCSNLNHNMITIDHNIIDVLDLILGMQKKFASKFQSFDNMSLKERVKWTKEYLMHINCEGVELLEMLPFKHWKNYDNFKLDEINIKYEIIDMFHFFLDICLVWGITGEELAKLYFAKNKHNFERQEDPKLGYVKTGGKKDGKKHSKKE